MKNKIVAMLAVVVFASSLFAQEKNVQSNNQAPEAQRVVVEIQQKPAPSPAPAPAAPPQSAAKVTSEWIEVGNAFGASIGGALKSAINETKDVTFGKDVTIVQGIDNFSKTDVGRFTMFAVGWKVMGKDAIVLFEKMSGAIIGIPILVTLFGLYLYIIRRFFMTRMVLIKKTGPLFSKDRVVEYGVVNVGRVNDSKYTNGEYTQNAKVLSVLGEETRLTGLILATLIYLVVSAIVLFSVVF